ncbi:TonB-dependent copper receptor [Alkalilimnicola ehrlichii]|uniref:TonB-dependent copper receptor n=2 Tax=Alkalilimnicola ehrlichii TaxID=351052 RepID=A0A3E0WTA7_9GAMM|nr:TonB-dependent copper receptor [Alkalilimnicola ehrlichii]RFA35197.1 TonB-dependent copper receptor [Alkalilimnicola ehrlichii]
MSPYRFVVPPVVGLLTTGAFTSALAEEHARLAPVVITAPGMIDAGRIETDPKQPRLPLPAHDGGSYLKSIPGFTTSRKGGTSGDPELRGLGGSRLRLQLDGSEILGGCAGRMDPPTAYVYPESYDRIEIIKGPQSVRYGSSAAGVVRFERDTPRFDEPDVRGQISTTVGSFDRNDLMADISAGDQTGYTRLIGTVSRQDNYEDGDGQTVHSEYQRWSTTAILGWTPSERTSIEFSYDRSDGQAAYADRGMDGTLFDRTGYQLVARHYDLTPWLAEVEARAYYNHIDHVMDEFRLREGMRRAMNPDRRLRGGRLNVALIPTENTWLTVGADYLDDRHRTRMAMQEQASSFAGIPRQDTAEFEQYGVFAELEHTLTSQDRFTYGLRADRNEVTELRTPAQASDSNTLWSGFARYQRDLRLMPLSTYIGIGRAERAPDFWERNRRFDIDSEVLNQVDVGAGFRSGSFQANASLFYGVFDDYILIDYRDGGEGAINIDATQYGAEFDATLQLTATLSTTATLSWVRATNDTHNRPLAQTPPLEGSLSLDYNGSRYFAGAVARGVTRQDRIHPGFGTIYSVDGDETPGFGTMSFYGGYRLTPQITATAGVDNLYDRAYAEHIQRSGGGYLTPADTPINEPGRTLWARISATF